jgi:membrane protease YdiL (CAAX protease family)
MGTSTASTTAPATARRAALWSGALFAMIFPTAAAWGYFLALAGGEAAPNPWLQGLYVGSKVVQFAFPIVFLWLLREPWPRLVLPGRKGLLLGFGFGVLVAAVILGVYFLSLRHTPGMRLAAGKIYEKLAQGGMATPGRYLLLAGFIIVPHSLLEEYYWRWFVFGRLRQLTSLLPAVVVSSLAFMAHHVIILYVYLPGKLWTEVVPFSLAIAVGGAVWAWLYDRVGTLYPSWLGHLLVDAAILVVGWDLLLQALPA